MRDTITGQRWQERSDVCPALINATEIAGKHVLSVMKIIQPYWMLDYTFADYGRYRTGSAHAPWKSRLLRTAHLYPPYMPYWEDLRKEQSYRHSAWISFSGGAEAGLDHLIHAKHGYARFVDETGRLGEVIRQAAQIGQKHGERGFWNAQALLCQALDLLLQSEHLEKESYRILAIEQVPSTSELAQTVEQFLRDNLAEKITLKMIAHHAHVSVSTLAHRYREETGETPITTLARLRIDHAKVLLLRGWPLKTIAEQLGFSDAFHLSKAFKRVEGISPKMFVKSSLSPPP